MSIRVLIGASLSFLLLCPPAHPQQRNPKILLLYDMEGISGATEYKHTTVAHPNEYALGRQFLTDDVNAAVAGLKAAGAGEIVVVDGHSSGNTTGPDVLEDQLLPPARMHYRETSFDNYMDSFDHSFDAIVAIGMHTGAGNAAGFLSHTITAEDVEYRVNGVPFSESMILAAGAARFKIPLIMISGDDQLEKEVKRDMPWVRYAIVKRAISRTQAQALSADEARQRIEMAAREALRDIGDARLPEWPGPYRFTLTFQDQAQALIAALVPGAEILANSAGVQIWGKDFEEGYRLSRRLILLAMLVGRDDARRAVLAAQPNASALGNAVADRVYDRFLNRLPTSSPSPAGPARYWGSP
jgi:D-amino peptidase